MIAETLSAIQEGLRSKEHTLVELVQRYLENIKTHVALNAYVEYWEEEALQRAEQLDHKRMKGERIGRLHGVVISIKDVICYKDHKVSAGSAILAGFISQYSATAIERLLAEDAILIGRTNCDEFAMGSTNESSYYGPVRNNFDASRVAGGSSGGAAVSVQTNTCLVALGSDTGGSVRQPAAFCGVCGFKPSYGAISRYGLIAYGSSFDQIGLISKDISAIRLVLEIIQGKDTNDATSVDIGQFDVQQTSGALTLACFTRELIANGVSADILKNYDFALQQLSSFADRIDEIGFDLIEYLVPTYYVLTTAEASSNLGRYDGVRYGHRSAEAADLTELYINSRTEGFGEEVKRRIMMGTFVLSLGYYEAYFTKAQQVRQLVVDAMNDIFKQYDFLLIPTTTAIPGKLGEASEDPIQMYMADVFTVLANLAGLPAISIPVNSDPNLGFPSGIQLIGPYGSDAKILELSERMSGMLLA